MPVRLAFVFCAFSAWSGPALPAEPTLTRQEMVTFAKAVFIGVQGTPAQKIHMGLDLLDKYTEEKKPTIVRETGTITDLTTHWVVSCRVSSIEAEKCYVRKAFGYEIPGNTLTARLKCDRLVHLWFPVDQMHLARDRFQNGALYVCLPPIARISVEAPTNEEPTFEDELGLFRTSWIDGTKMELMRKELQEEANLLAEELVKTHLRSLMREITHDVQKEFRRLMPDKTVAFEERSGTPILKIPEYFPVEPPARKSPLLVTEPVEAVEPPAPGEQKKTPILIVAGVLALSLVAVVFGRRKPVS
jgi:hypothetical protein